VLATDGVAVPGEAVVVDGAELRLLGGRCKKCGLTAFPVLARCPNCWGPLAAIALSRTGSLYSYSVVHVSSAARHTPYTVGYVDITEGARVFAVISETDEELLAPDIEVELILRRDGDGFLAVWQPSGKRVDGP
jgi:uncharacterized protein